MATRSISKLITITHSTESGGTQYCIRFPFAKLQIIAGFCSFTGGTPNSVDSGKLYTSDNKTVAFTNQFNTIFGGSVSKGGMSANTSIFNASFTTSGVTMTFWRGAQSTGGTHEAGYIAVGLYT